MLRGTWDRVRLLDLVENFTLFSEHKAGLLKIIVQNHQFLGVNDANASMLDARKRGHGRGACSGRRRAAGGQLANESQAANVRIRPVQHCWLCGVAMN
jgi:type I restriction enzyme R subunit